MAGTVTVYGVRADCPLRLTGPGGYDHTQTPGDGAFTGLAAGVGYQLTVGCMGGCTGVWFADWLGASASGSVDPTTGDLDATVSVIDGGDTHFEVRITCGGAGGGDTGGGAGGGGTADPSCCPSVWWCLDGGGYDSFPVGDRPDGVTGMPWASAAEANAGCPPPPPLAMECPAGTATSIPGAVDLTIADCTGSFPLLFDFNSVRVPLTASGVSAADGSVAVEDVFGNVWRARVSVACAGSPCFPGEWYVEAGLSLETLSDYGCSAGPDIVATAPWIGLTDSFYACRTAGDPAFADGEGVGTYTYSSCTGLSGSYTLFVSAA